MKTHLALLRGINVSGHNMIKMDVLKSVLENAGFHNVRTYIQSGNVFVDSEEEHGASVGFTIKQEIFQRIALFGSDSFHTAVIERCGRCSDCENWKTA